MSGPLRALSLLLQLALFAALAAFSAYGTFKYFVRARPAFPVPALVGLPSHEALALLTESGFALRSLGTEPAEWTEAGEVLTQRPEPGVIMREGGAVEVVLASGDETLVMPDYIGVDVLQARRLLGYNRLKTGLSIPLARTDRRPGVVVASNPAPGDPIKPGAVVDLVVAQPEPERSYFMPDLAIRPAGEVLEALEKIGAADIAVDFDSDVAWPDGVVISQTPPPGALFRPAEPMRLVVNQRGPTPGEEDQLIHIRWPVPPGFENRHVIVAQTDGHKAHILADRWLEAGSVFTGLYLLLPGATVTLGVDGVEVARWREGRRIVRLMDDPTDSFQ